MVLSTLCALTSRAAEIEACYAFDIPEGTEPVGVRCLQRTVRKEMMSVLRHAVRASAEGYAVFSEVVWCSDAAGCFDVEDDELRESV